MEVGTALHAIRHRWFVIALITAAMAAVAGVFALFNPPMYTATAEGLFSVASPETRPPYALANGSQYILDRMTSYAQLGRTTPVLAPVVNDLHLQETPLTLSGRVTSKSLADKVILEVSVKYNDPVIAAHIADATLTQIGRTVSRIENGNIKVTAVGPATVPRESSRLTLIVYAVVGAVAGLVLGLLVAVGLEVIRQRGEWRASLPRRAQ
jgi:capsular polysaccharide biosynthesis protein